MRHWTTIVRVLIAVSILSALLLWLKPYWPILYHMKHKEVLLVIVGFIMLSIYTAYSMYPAIRPFDSAKVGPLSEYRDSGSPECF